MFHYYCLNPISSVGLEGFTEGYEAVQNPAEAEGIPTVDGCKLLFLAFEGLTRRAVPARIQAMVNAAGIVALLMLMVAVTFSDITKFL